MRKFKLVFRLWVVGVFVSWGANRVFAVDDGPDPNESWYTVLYDSFEQAEPDQQLPDPWSGIASRGEARAYVVPAQSASLRRGTQCLKIEDAGGDPHLANAVFEFAELLSPDAIRVTADVRVEQDDGEWSVLVIGPDNVSGPVIKFGGRDSKAGQYKGWISAVGPSYESINLSKLQTRKWYRLRIEMNLPGRSCTVSVRAKNSDWQHFYNVDSRRSLGSIEKIILGTWSYAAIGEVWIDNIRMEVNDRDMAAEVDKYIREPRVNTIAAARISQPPVIDGKLDEKCWKEADEAAPFHRIKSAEEATENSRSYVAYDAEKLYVGVFCKESQMSNIRPGSSGGPGDQDTWSADEVELSLLPKSDSNKYFQLCVGAGGGTYDSVSDMGATWNGEWTAATHQGDDYWSAEYAIPFTSLVCQDWLVGTPVTGQEWGINFYRHEIRLNEISGWSRTLSGFHDPLNCGRVKFEPPPASANAVYPENVNPGNLFVGNDHFQLQLRNNRSADVAVTVKLRVGDIQAGGNVVESQAQVSLPANGGGTLSVPYALAGGRRYELSFQAKDEENRILYQARGMLDIPDVRTKLTELEDRLAQAGEAIQALGEGGSFEEVAAEIDNLRNRLASIRWDLREGSLDREVWEGVSGEAEQLLSDPKVARAATLYSFIQSQSDEVRNKGYLLGKESPQNLVFYDTMVDKAAIDGIELSLARREYQSAQLVIMAPWEKLEDVKVSAAEFVAQDGPRLPCPEMHLVGYLAIPRAQDKGMPGDRLWWPDLLVPNQAVSVAEGGTQAIWLTFHAPADADPGTYTGTVTVKPENLPATEVPVTVNVWDFTLPHRSHLATDFWMKFGWDQSRYGFSLEDMDWWRSFAEMVASYRVSAFPYQNIFAWMVEISIEKDGSYSFDLAISGFPNV